MKVVNWPPFSRIAVRLILGAGAGAAVFGDWARHWVAMDARRRRVSGREEAIFVGAFECEFGE